MNTKIDEAANGMKAEMNTVRRPMEEEHGTMMCASRDCKHEAADGSCYCDECERRIS